MLFLFTSVDEASMSKAFGFILTLLIGSFIYWRKTKDNTDKELEAKIEDNQKIILKKIEQVLSGQHAMDVSINKAFSKIEQHDEKIVSVISKQEQGLKDLAQVKEKVAVNEEWKKRVEDKLAI